MSDYTDSREGVAFGSMVVAWFLLYLWASMWVWANWIPDPKGTWWLVPALLSTFILSFSPLAILSWVCMYYESKEEEKPLPYDKLVTFFKEIAQLTVNHGELNDMAVVSPIHLGAALEKVDPNWWKKVNGY